MENITANNHYEIGVAVKDHYVQGPIAGKMKVSMLVENLIISSYLPYVTITLSFKAAEDGTNPTLVLPSTKVSSTSPSVSEYTSIPANWSSDITLSLNVSSIYFNPPLFPGSKGGIYLQVTTDQDIIIYKSKNLLKLKPD